MDAASNDAVLCANAIGEPSRISTRSALWRVIPKGMTNADNKTFNPGQIILEIRYDEHGALYLYADKV